MSDWRKGTAATLLLEAGSSGIGKIRRAAVKFVGENDVSEDEVRSWLVEQFASQLTDLELKRPRPANPERAGHPPRRSD